MMKTPTRKTSLDGNNYCYPCVFSGGIWTDEDDTVLG